MIRNIVCLSDSHFGSTLAVSCRYRLDDGGFYCPSPLQQKLLSMWNEFWAWTYKRLEGEPFVFIHNGDVIDGVHHRTTTISSHNLNDQTRLAIQMLKPHVDRASAYYQIRGTEAHCGQSAKEEEAIAETLGAVRDKETGQYSRWELRIEMGQELLHISHHIGVTSSSSYESSALMREMVAAFVEAGQWGMKPPTIFIRSHRHRYSEVKIPNGRIVITPGWQAKTPFVFKMDRMRAPMFGGLLIRRGKEGVHIREKLFTIKAAPPEKI